MVSRHTTERKFGHTMQCMHVLDTEHKELELRFKHGQSHPTSLFQPFPSAFSIVGRKSA